MKKYIKQFIQIINNLERLLVENWITDSKYILSLNSKPGYFTRAEHIEFKAILI